MPVQLTPPEIRRKYDGAARRYDWMEGPPELLGVRRLRRALLRQASGEVLEVAAGTGRNLPYDPRDCRITAVDLSPSMLEVARKRAAASGLHVRLLVMDGDALAVCDRGFDTVVSSLTLCMFPDPVAALRETARVCRTAGRILRLEHGRSDRLWLGRWQDRRAAAHARPLGCHWNREPLELVRRAALQVVTTRRASFGVVHLIEARPPERGTGGTRSAGPVPGSRSRAGPTIRGITARDR